MSQRTPSHRSAIDATTSAAAARDGRQRRVELQHLGPGREVRVAAAGDDGVADREEAVGIAREVVGRAAHEVLGVLGRPRVVGRDVVGDEVEDQADAARRQLLAGHGQAASPPRRSSTR